MADKGWTIYNDGELVFSADTDKWQEIGPAIGKIMANGPAAPVQHRVRLRLFGGRAEVTIEGNGPLPPGIYRGTVARLADSMGKVTP